MPSREVKVAILGDPSSLQRALQQSERGVSTFASRMGRVSDRMRSVGSSMTRNLTLPLVGFGVLAFRELSAGERALAQTQAVIESTGGAANKSVDDIVDLARSLSDLTSLDDEPIQEAANTLLTFKNIAGDTFDAATEATLDLSVAMDQDLRSSAVQIGKALNDPIKGLTALQRVGVTFTDRQKEMIRQMVFFGDTAGAQKIILEELNSEFGGSAEALGETTTGRLNRFRNKLEDVGASILEDLLPALEDIVDVVDRVADAYDNLSPGQQKFIAWAALAAAVAGPLSSALGILTLGIKGVALAMTFISAHPLVLLGIAVVALIGAIALLIMNWHEVSNAMSSFVRLAASSIPGVRTAVMLVGEGIEFVRSAVGRLMEALQLLGQVTLAGLNTAIAVVTGNLQTALNAASNLLSLLTSIGGQSIPKGPISVPGDSMDSTNRAGSSFIPKRGRGPRVVTNRGPGMADMKQAFREALREEVQMVHVTNASMGEVY